MLTAMLYTSCNRKRDHAPNPPKSSTRRAGRTNCFECLALFDQIYDATKTFQRKSLMKRLAVEDLMAGDMVLVEVKIVRRRVGRERRTPDWDWASWRDEFVLEAISQLVARDYVRRSAMEPPTDTFALSM
ncbi:hypothetical protein C8Q79DRAFT_283358 [Trametes meyenii]|nr:hypothetical protein C8Q79DRAFT_283358 [Trametes meyenii]